ncbi:MAG: 3'-5' exoribonuclease domain-containing protein [Anaerolineales bacterium]|jgi:DNA polymerase III epsilon subunit-like protein
MQNSNHAYISIDVETAGPNPSTYSLLSIGACDVFDTQNTFYVEIKPVNENKIDSAMGISGLDWQDLIDNGLHPTEAMSNFADWVNRFYQDGFTPLFVAFNAPFDWMFVNDYFHRYLGQNPFGHTALDIKAFYMGLHRTSWEDTRMQYVSNRYLNAQSLSHHALQDALDQAKIFRKMLVEVKIQGENNG